MPNFSPGATALLLMDPLNERDTFNAATPANPDVWRRYLAALETLSLLVQSARSSDVLICYTVPQDLPQAAPLFGSPEIPNSDPLNPTNSVLIERLLVNYHASISPRRGDILLEDRWEYGCLSETGLLSTLWNNNRIHVVLAGFCATEHAQKIARDFQELGLALTLVSDATFDVQRLMAGDPANLTDCPVRECRTTTSQFIDELDAFNRLACQK